MGTSDNLQFNNCDAAAALNVAQFAHLVMEHNREWCEAFCGGCNWAPAPDARARPCRLSGPLGRCPHRARTPCSA